MVPPHEPPALASALKEALERNWNPDAIATGVKSWENVAVSVTDGGMNAILANPTMIKAYKDGIPGNGQPFPEGSMTVKIEWKKKQTYDWRLF